jgi:hypothetical protein
VGFAARLFEFIAGPLRCRGPTLAVEGLFWM